MYTPSFDPNCVLIRIIKEIQLSPNAQAVCERAGSKYARFKSKSTNKMKLPIIKVRCRVVGNGLPIHLFQPTSVYHYWVENRDSLVEKISDKAKSYSLVINRLRRDSENSYTSKLFLDFN